MSISYQPLDIVLQDIQEIQNARKGKGRADAPISDDQLALQDQLTTIMSHMTLLDDIRVAQSLNDAARSTGFVPKLSVVEITGTCAHCQAR